MTAESAANGEQSRCRLRWKSLRPIAAVAQEPQLKRS